MTNFIFVFALIWLCAIVIWWLVSKYAKNADLDKLKSRILENPDKKAKKKAKTGPAMELLPRDDANAGKLVIRLLQKFELQKRLETLLEQSGLKWRPVRLIHTCLGIFLGVFLTVRFVAGIPYLSLQLGAGLAAALLPIFYVVKVRAKRLHRFEELFPESLEFVSRSMRAGHAFSVSLEMLHREFPEPLSGEFRRTFDEHNLGLPLEQALMKLAKRVPSLDVHFFVSAVLLQKRTGGNLAEILDKLAGLIRERFKLRGKIRAISAHGRMTGLALTIIPIGVALMMFYVNPSYVSFFVDDELGNVMMGIAVLLQVLGYLIIRKIVTIEI